MASDLKLPALKSLGQLADHEPVIVYDSREQTPLLFTRLQSVRGTLQSGDYSIIGLENLFSVERKSIDDLAGCCMGQNRERFERELHHLRGFRFKRLLIVGSEEEILAARYRSAIRPQSIMASLATWETRYDLPVVFSPTPEAAAAQVERWVYWFAREAVVVVNDLLRAITDDVGA
jgi:DNA excision repair protein ERCC-4